MNNRQYKVQYLGGNMDLFRSFHVSYYNALIGQWREVKNHDMKYRLIKQFGGMQNRDPHN